MMIGHILYESSKFVRSSWEILPSGPCHNQRPYFLCACSAQNMILRKKWERQQRKARNAACIENLQMFRVQNAAATENQIFIALHSREAHIVGTVGRVGRHMEIHILNGKRKLETWIILYNFWAGFWVALGFIADQLGMWFWLLVVRYLRPYIHPFKSSCFLWSEPNFTWIWRSWAWYPYNLQENKWDKFFRLNTIVCIQLDPAALIFNKC